MVKVVVRRLLLLFSLLFFFVSLLSCVCVPLSSLSNPHRHFNLLLLFFHLSFHSFFLFSSLFFSFLFFLLLQLTPSSSLLPLRTHTYISLTLSLTHISLSFTHTLSRLLHTLILTLPPSPSHQPLHHHTPTLASFHNLDHQFVCMISILLG